MALRPAGWVPAVLKARVARYRECGDAARRVGGRGEGVWAASDGVYA